MDTKPIQILYHELEDDFDTISKYIESELVTINSFAAKLPVPLKLDMNMRKRGDKGSITLTFTGAVQVLWNKHESISAKIWKDLAECYLDMPRTKQVEVDGKKEYRTIGRNTVLLEQSTLDMMTDIAVYMRNKDFKIPRMLSRGVGSPKVIGSVAVMYCARYYIPELDKG